MVPRTRQKFLRYETGLSVPTINEWIKYCREKCIHQNVEHYKRYSNIMKYRFHVL
ncbi:hypothetical protein G5I_07826 [Acromyrmex echinatior]|uniref:Uncharacterized protein n=1 Tax=Acromyrmex echinatior TaxID=103372 RepID=F4WPW2_ACREC|nr:hypothetical protein G5I_07826 [Acromyrmex echinatior]